MRVAPRTLDRPSPLESWGLPPDSRNQVSAPASASQSLPDSDLIQDPEAVQLEFLSEPPSLAKETELDLPRVRPQLPPTVNPLLTTFSFCFFLIGSRPTKVLHEHADRITPDLRFAGLLRRRDDVNRYNCSHPCMLSLHCPFSIASGNQTRTSMGQ
jgi:hypothetical protein